MTPAGTHDPGGDPMNRSRPARRSPDAPTGPPPAGAPSGTARSRVAAAAALLDAATAHLDAPLAAVDVGALRANAADLVARAAGTPVRVASKSVRCRAVLDEALGT